MIKIDGEKLTINQIMRVAIKNEKVKLTDSAVEKVLTSHELLTRILGRNIPVYGINTGFGIFSNKTIPWEDTERLNRNLILSHAVATGPCFSDDVVRAAMLIRANTLAKGFSGVRLTIISTILDMLNKNVIPKVPTQGSLGSSGDLCLLSHMALVFTTDRYDREEESGFATFNGKLLSGKRAMELAGIPRVILGPKEGLALNNGATFCAAIAALLLNQAEFLVNLADKAAALSLEALCGCSAAFDPRIHNVRNQIGQKKSAANIFNQIRGSSLVDSGNSIQDAYSLRCAPQVHGAIRDTISHGKAVVEREINAATDNPLLFDEKSVLSGGNFHGEPLGFIMDFLGIALTELGAISERRIFRLTDEHLNNGLPPMLVSSQKSAGINSGLMMPQYTAASLVLENQTLATPDSIHSLPTSSSQEDHNANATTAARHCFQIVLNVQHILSIELLTAARALDLRLQQKPERCAGNLTITLYNFIRSVVPDKAEDHLWGVDIEKLKKAVFDR